MKLFIRQPPVEPWREHINKAFREWRSNTEKGTANSFGPRLELTELIKAAQAVQVVLDTDRPSDDTRPLEVRIAEAVLQTVRRN